MSALPIPPLAGSSPAPPLAPVAGMPEQSFVGAQAGTQPAGEQTATGEQAGTAKKRESKRVKFRPSPEGQPEAASTFPKVPKSEAPITDYAAVYTTAPNGERVTWNPKLHLPLGKDDFESEANYWEWKAIGTEKTLRKQRQEATNCRSGLSGDAKKSQDKVSKALETFAEHKKLLEERMGPEAVQAYMQQMAAAAGFQLVPANGQAGVVAQPIQQPATAGL